MNKGQNLQKEKIRILFKGTPEQYCTIDPTSFWDKKVAALYIFTYFKRLGHQRGPTYEHRNST